MGSVDISAAKRVIALESPRPVENRAEKPVLLGLIAWIESGCSTNSTSSAKALAAMEK